MQETDLGAGHADGSSSVAGRTQLSGRSRMGSLTGVQILGVGGFVPDRVVSNQDLELLGFDADWILQRTGIAARRRAADGVATSDLAVEAARRCLDNAGVGSEEVDLIVVATMTSDHATPTTACNVQARLGSTAPAMDVNAACSGFIYALVTGMQFVKSGSARRVLVIGADIMSRLVDPEDRKTYPLFGDGAGAVLLGPGDDRQGLLSYTLGTEGDEGTLLCIPAGGSREPITHEVLDQGRHYVRMDGRAVFKWAVRLIQDVYHDLTLFAEVDPSDLDLFMMHQANLRIIDSAIDALGIDRTRVVTNLDRYGNTTGGSIPLVLNEAVQEGRIERGRHLFLLGFGAGLAWGGCILRW